ncbi:MAG TPA: T9SS type A sorting domain-containing protein, partial [Ignavibacteriaceae bacterium]|nr:T9SS type A sorting domain-containing protein [Ignavibacteriaceae bacterium]
QYRLKQIDYDGSYEYSKIIEVDVNIPSEFFLSQNYPNPFNPSTKIKFTIQQTDNPLLGGARGGFVSLKVYDILGIEIATLVNEEKPTGNYEVEFDATGLSSGTYFYKIIAGYFLSVKKMLLMK